LRRNSSAHFTTEGQDGNGTIYVLVKALGAELWRVVISIEEIQDEDEGAGASGDDAGDEWDGFPQAPATPAASALKRPPGQLSARPPAAPPAPPPPPAPVVHAAPPAPPAPPQQAYVRPKGSPQGEAKIQKCLRVMLQMRASDLHLSSGAEPMVRVDGEMTVMEGSQGPLRSEELIDMMMAIAPTDVRRQYDETNDADFAYELDGFGRFRFNYFLDRRGPALVARQIPFDIVTPEHLGLPSAVTELCWLSKGLVLVTGPTGSGKSTTLASLIDFINRNRADHIITIEDPIEYVHPNKRCLVNQRQVGVHTASFSHALRAALREDPDIIVVGEMRDLETISIAIETAETGHLVFGTLHTTTAPSTVDRIIDQFPADEQGQIRSMLSESLRGVVSQVLCKKNGGGRVGAYEVLLVNSAASNLIREGKTFQLRSLMQTARAQGMQTMNDHLFDLVKSRVVDPKEAFIRAYDKVNLREAMQKARIPLDPSIFRDQD
jgi:twitching motility protein PilT